MKGKLALNDEIPTNLKVKTLKDYTPRELLAELIDRGYVWDKMYVKQYVEYSKI